MMPRRDSENRDGFGKGPRPFPILALLLAVLLPGIGHAAEACYSYTVYQSGGTFAHTGTVTHVGATPNGICPALAAALVGYTNGSITWTAVTGSWSSSGGGTYGRCALSYTQVASSTGAVSYPSGNSLNIARPGSAACPADPCDALEGLLAQGGGSGSWSGANLCRTEDAAGNPMPFAGGCRVERAGSGINMSGGWFGQTRVTGGSCTGAETVVEADPPDCVTGPAGQVCISEEQEGCGTFNGEYVCLGAVPDGSCMLLAGGGAICTEGAGPVDEMDVPLEPDAIVENVVEGEAIDLEYFGPTTVATGVGPLPGSSSSGEGSGIGPPREMPEESVEFGAGPDDEWDAAAGMGAALSGVSSSSWFGVLTGSASALSGSSACPSVVLDVPFMDTSFDLFESACGYMAPHYSMWTVIMQIAWGLLALRIFLAGSRG